MPELKRIASQTFRVPLFERADEVVRSLSSSGRLLFHILATLIVLSSAGLLFMVNNAFLVDIPAHGGSFTEGEIGNPRFINPLLALSDADNDLAALVYSGLLKARSNGTFIPDLASSYDVSPDGRRYTVYLRPDIRFHDGTPVTADDIVFTVEKALDPAIKSPLRANWEGVHVTKVDEHTVEFTLSEPYAPFVENLTMGILPKHAWAEVSAEEFPFSNLNVEPVGSGPYRISKVERNASGIPSSYELKSFSGYALGEPYIARFSIRFYQNETALVEAIQKGDVEAGSGISPALLKELKGFRILTAPENRVFGVFFNQNQNEVLRSAPVRKALRDAIDQEALLEAALGGYGMPAVGPVPPGIGTIVSSQAEPSENRAVLAKQSLIDAGWKEDESGVLTKTTGSGKSVETQTLSFTLSTGNVPELTAAAEFLKEAWGNMGVKVEVKVFNQGDLSQNVIRPRRYDALLFGEIVGHALDLFAFWHSSQRNDPGLNIALYANATADKALTDLRQAQDEEKRQELYEKFEAEIQKDVPAVFLYSPDFVYVFPERVQGLALGSIKEPRDRFNSVEEWYVRTDHVWTLFTNTAGRD